MVALLGLTTLLAAVNADTPDYNNLWVQFKAEFGRAYNDDSEESRRFQIFKAKVDEIYEVNAQNLPYKLGINKFTDVTAEEMRALYTGRKPAKKPFGGLAYLGKHESTEETLADAIDWVDEGAVTPVKDQGSCGSCWAFGTTGSLEGRWYLHTGSLLSLSEQQLIDCDKGDDGCDGGMEDTAIEYASGAGMCSESDYKYKARDSSCESSSCSKVIPAGGFTGYKDVGSSASALMSALHDGPVNVGVDAGGSFGDYSRGVLTRCNGKDIDHAVLAVGYGTDNGQDYWKIKNSWGSSWGENGYIRVTRSGNPCGMLDELLYPVTSGPTPTPTPTPTRRRTPTPTPTRRRTPTPTPTPSPSSHYGQPPCAMDEEEMDFDEGLVCATPCNSDDDCPMVPDDAYYYAECGVIYDDFGNDFCGIPCDRNRDCQHGAFCSDVCMYDYSGKAAGKSGFHIKQREHVTV